MSFSWLNKLSQRLPRPSSRSQRRQQKKSRTTPQLETLEARDVPAAVAHPDYVVRVSPNGVTPDQTAGPTGYTPSQIDQAYGFNQISFNGTAGTGAGTTIAIVDAYSDPSIASDLQAFDKEFNLAAANLTIVNQSGGSSLPKGNTGWAGEISLDVEWAHAVAPGAKILLVEATNASYANLFTAVRYGAAQKGVVAVSMSWGGSEFSGETAYDSSSLTPPASNPDVVYVNSSGDSGSPANYPSSSPDVLSVGGTSLTLSTSGTYESETVWDDSLGSSGGGISKYESQPSFQKGVVTQSTTKRTDPDVAYDADPETGFPVYQTYGNSVTTPWLEYGGTSDASPQWAALIAIADQGRIAAGESPLSNSTLMPTLYQAPSADFHDITTGHSGGSSSYKATTGYDLATGLGTPVANLLVSTLVGSSIPSNAATHFSITPASSNESQGSSFSITVTALTASGATATNYTGTVQFTSSDAGDNLPKNFTFPAADDGTATFTITLNTPGKDTVSVSDASNSSITGTASYTVSAPYFAISGIPSSLSAGIPENFTVEAFNANGTEDTTYSGTVQFTSSDSKAQFSSNDTTLSGGTGSFTITFETAGTQSVTASDTVNTAMTGSETGIAVAPGSVAQLIFTQQPSNAGVGTAISPAVTVEELDQFGNVLTNDTSGSITLALTTSNGATLSGGGTVTVSDGVATFSGLSVNTAGSYSLTATEGSLTAISSSFTISSTTSNVIENFQNGLSNYYYMGSSYPYVGISTAAAHPGTATDGLYDEGDGNWYFREDSGAVINPGDTVSVWVQFASAANGRAYFGFGTTDNGLDSVVLAPNTGQFIIQNNAGFDTYTNLAVSNQTYSANQWYLVQVQWSTTGKVIANLYSSNGTTLLNSISDATGDTTAGTFAFRAIGSTKYFSTVSDTPGVNTFGPHAISSSQHQTGSGSDYISEESILPVTSGVSVSTGGHGNTSGTTGQNPMFWLPPTQSGKGKSPPEKLWFAIQEELGKEAGFFPA